MNNDFKFKEKMGFSAWRMEDSSQVKYLEQVINILAKYSFIYKTRNTDLFLNNVLEDIPFEVRLELFSQLLVLFIFFCNYMCLFLQELLVIRIKL